MNQNDLQRLVEIITEELLAAQGPAGLQTRCGCHAVQSDCCPTRLLACSTLARLAWGCMQQAALPTASPR